jgi:WD40 repeat protein
VLPDGRIASGSDNNTIRLWNAKTGRETVRLEAVFRLPGQQLPHGQAIRAAASIGSKSWIDAHPAS